MNQNFIKNNKKLFVIFLLFIIIIGTNINSFAKTTSVTSVCLNKSKVTIKTGETCKLLATIFPTSASNKKISWESSNPSVATVSNKGLITAKNEGKATITVTTKEGKKTAKCKVTVKNDINWSSIIDLNINKNEANKEKKMAHNIYSYPKIKNTSNKYNGFLIDFKADYTANGTYWSLCNWKMNLNCLNGNITKKNGGAYAGLQLTADGPKAIMSFWKIEYKDKNGRIKTIIPKLIYPKNVKSNQFRNEGEGVKYLADYNWEKGKWYRMYIKTYVKNNTTYAEQWIQNIEKNKWTHICTFDTGLPKSWMEGYMQQFMENYIYDTCNEIRSFEYKNIYVKDFSNSKWVPIKGASLSIDTEFNDKKGNASFGATSTTLYGITNGSGKDMFKKGEEILKYYTIITDSDPIEPY